MPKKQAKKSSKRRLDFAAAGEDGDDSHTKKRSRTTVSSPASKRSGKQSTIQSFSSPVSKSRTVVAVTPEEQEEKGRKELSKYVPKYIHKNLDYKRRGDKSSSLPEITRKVFGLIEENYDIPQDFEQQRAYGPLSGTSYEERVIQEYSLGKLNPKARRGTNTIEICTCCASLGHKRFDCPTLV